MSAAQPQTPGEHILQPEWPADKVERRAVAALIPYARNARTHSPDQAARKELCDQTRGRRSLAWEEAKPKRISNIFRPNSGNLGGGAAERALTQQFRSAVVNLINHVLIFMSVIKNNGYACSFCNSDSGDGAAHRRRRREAPRCKT